MTGEKDKGWLAIAGLGPGDEALVTPEVTAALAGATDVIGYIPYVARIAAREGSTLPLGQPGGARPRRLCSILRRRAAGSLSYRQ